ncbi:hypothetical protein [Paraburkholderia sp. MM5477-R1]|uniref:hypothetical protein n=1 Tax=Paraburkholderia sp. MM5477-R1 TaxID=2991062 RepID=UPI003D23D1D8
MNDVIFESTPQALHVSFLILSQPAMQKIQMRAALIRAMEALPDLSGPQRCWLDRLRGARSSNVCFGELDMLEVRGQCSLIVAAVTDRLPRPERAALLARFGAGPEKGLGIMLLVAYARSRAGITSRRVLTALVMRHYAPRKSLDGMSIRDLADRLKVDRNKLFRAARWMACHFAVLESMGIERLHRIFERDGVVEEDPAEHDEAVKRVLAAVRRTSVREAAPRKAQRAQSA